MATTSPFSRALALAAAFSILAASAAPALAAGAAAKEEPAEPIEIQPQEVRVVGPDGEPAPPPPQTEVERYCSSVADRARDARYAAQASDLQTMEAKVAAKIDELEAKRAEYQKWLEERRAFLDGADTILLDIFTKMKPDSAAVQLAGLDRSVAAALLAKLKPRQASAILSEMKPAAAAEIAGIIAAKTADPDAPDAAAAPGKAAEGAKDAAAPQGSAT